MDTMKYEKLQRREISQDNGGKEKYIQKDGRNFRERRKTAESQRRTQAKFKRRKYAVGRTGILA